MEVEFIASLADRGAGMPGLAEDADYPARLAALHEEAGFDRVLVGNSASAPDAAAVASQVLTTTSRLGVLLAHQPGAVAPTVAARQLATLDAFYPGRVALQVSTHDTGQGSGTGLDQAASCHQLDEFLQVVKLAWRSAEPFDFAGECYRVTGGWSAVRPAAGSLPVHVAGTSDQAMRAGGRHADVYALGCEPAAAVGARIAPVLTAAARHGRSPRFSVSVRSPLAAARPGATGGAAGARADRQAPTRGHEQATQLLLGYLTAGVSTLVLHGGDPERDAADYAQVITMVRERLSADRTAGAINAAARPPGP